MLMDGKYSYASLLCAPCVRMARRLRNLPSLAHASLKVRIGGQMQPTPQILVVSSEIENRRALNEILRKEGHETICASRVSECREALQTHGISLIFCDRRLSDGNYRDVITAARSAQQLAKVVVTSRLADWDEYLDALHHGAFDLIASPCQPTDVLWAIVQARRESTERADFLAVAKPRSAPATA